MNKAAMMALVFVWPVALIAWGIFAVLGTPLFLETGFLIGPLFVLWALTLFLLRHRVKRSGVLGRPVVD